MLFSSNLRAQFLLVCLFSRHRQNCSSIQHVGALLCCSDIGISFHSRDPVFALLNFYYFCCRKSLNLKTNSRNENETRFILRVQSPTDLGEGSHILLSILHFNVCQMVSLENMYPAGQYTRQFKPESQFPTLAGYFSESLFLGVPNSFSEMAAHFTPA